MTVKQPVRKAAVALSYNPTNSDVPKVIAKGKGQVAEKILEQAEIHNIPVQQDPNLVQLLGQLDLNQSIPEELYQAVAEVFAFIYKLDQFHEKLQNKYH